MHAHTLSSPLMSSAKIFESFFKQGGEERGREKKGFGRKKRREESEDEAGERKKKKEVRSTKFGGDRLGDASHLILDGNVTCQFVLTLCEHENMTYM